MVGIHSLVSFISLPLDPRFFEMSEEQINYYTQCFLQLQRKTSEHVSMSGAVSGGDERVVDFFRKSRLDTKTLSKVWALADVNADGFLNHAEFILAMHLIVLHVKVNSLVFRLSVHFFF